MDLNLLNKQLEEWETRYQEWSEPINEVWRESLRRLNRDGYVWYDMLRDVGRARQEQGPRYDPYPELWQLLDDAISYGILSGTAAFS